MLPASASITEILLRADARGEPLGPYAVTFLVRRYVATGATELRGVLERGLTSALEGLATGHHPKADWLHTLCEAAAVSDDKRILDAVADAANGLRAEWPGRGAIAQSMRSVDACLTAAAILSAAPAGLQARTTTDHGLIGAAVDELERVIGIAYHPGEMLPRSVDRPEDADGGIEEHVAAATALLTAHDVTARLPYSMLAEELIQALRTSRGPEGPLYTERWSTERCALARVLCRLARLHDDEEYRRAAVIARSCDYRADAKAVLDAMAPQDAESAEGASMFGVAMDELVRAS
jgi:uncharacterized protein YyaL (SSP411 family)